MMKFFNSQGFVAIAGGAVLAVSIFAAAAMSEPDCKNNAEANPACWKPPIASM